MRTVVVLLSVLLAEAAFGFQTSGERGEGNAASFSEEFKSAYTAAGVDQSDPSCIAKLEAMLSQFTGDEEQAEIQLSLGVIFVQRTGLVDPAKAVRRRVMEQLERPSK